MGGTGFNEGKENLTQTRTDRITLETCFGRGVHMKKYALAAAFALSTLGMGSASSAAVVMVNSASETAQTLSLSNGLYNITVSGRVLIAGADTTRVNDDRLADADFFQRTPGNTFFDTTENDSFDVGLEVNGSLSVWDSITFRPDSVYSILYTVTTGSISFLFRDRPGTYGDNVGSLRVEVSAVPLPASALGLLAGLAGLGLLRRRKTA